MQSDYEDVKELTTKESRTLLNKRTVIFYINSTPFLLIFSHSVYNKSIQTKLNYNLSITAFAYELEYSK